MQPQADYTQLDIPYRDPAFQQRIAQLQRAEELEKGRGPLWQDLLAKPWVKAEPYRENTETHCPLGHSRDHKLFWPPETHEGRAVVRRRCAVCSSTWFEPIDSVL